MLHCVMDEQLNELAKFFKALADANRLRIVGLLAQKEATGEELAAVLHLHPATISHHMARLREAGLVEARAESYYSVYRLKLDVIHALAKQLFSTASLAAVAADLDADAYDKKVLDDFMSSSGRLKTIPAQRKKRNVILRFILREFKPIETLPRGYSPSPARNGRREIAGPPWRAVLAGRFRRPGGSRKETVRASNWPPEVRVGRDNVILGKWSCEAYG